MFRFSRTGDPSSPLTVLYKIEGTAGAGTDYSVALRASHHRLRIRQRDIAVTPIDDSESEANETVVVTILADSGYSLGLPFSATVTHRQRRPPSQT